MGVLEGKVAVITGSTRGLGLAIAQAYAREGAAVMLSGRSERELEQDVSTLREQGRKVSYRITDVSDLEQVKALAEQAVREFGKIDIWVNNAGYGGVYGPTVAVSPEDFLRVVQTNMLGEYYGSMVALHYFTQQESGGKLINLLGRGDNEPVPLQNAYASSKAWVRNFTVALAKEHKRDRRIGIYAFNPGLVITDLLRKVDAVEGYEKRLRYFSTIIRLFANPSEVPAEKAVWLASSATDGKTGLVVRAVSIWKLFGGLFREVKRVLLRQPAPDTSVDVKVVKPYEWQTEVPSLEH
ncbi:MAG TPA: SDR family oxidoreductase [Ktedonobacteraceae bacterium]|jgi:NAD(P)-dependent dehydrogenase (short-subunit alcohol dehydrogenase family)|nr:SDR family oxidoreductase [Ktedonobacteraceae bacterium]